MKYFILLLFITFSAKAQISIETLPLMPWPQKIELKEEIFTLNKNFKVNITGQPNERIFAAATRFLRRLDARTGFFFEKGFVQKINEAPYAQLQINCSQQGKIGLNEDESFQLEITVNGIKVEATTDLGAIHALETVLQMLQTNTTSFYFPTAIVADFPRFTWRGLMIDSARHFQPTEVIKRNLDAMAALKMNVFHWHLVDDQGWRIEVKKHPKLTDKGSDGNFYTQEEMTEIVKYAADRGILVVPEIDVPGHASALLTAYPEIGSKQNWNKSTYAIEQNAGIFTPTLDPTNPKTYQILTEIFDEVCPLFTCNFFHIGGDVNEGKDWDSNTEIQDFKRKNKLKNNLELQTYFNLKLIPILKKRHKELMGWEEIMTENMSKEAIIHSWKGANEGTVAGKSLLTAAKNGFKTVLSNGYYIDLMQGIEEHYSNDPIPKNTVLSSEEMSRILGGEATMWTELVSPETIDSRIWPRTAAIAERLWSDENITDLTSLRQRLKVVSFRLEELGITHIKNKEMILRNISNNQPTVALVDFTNLCEPLKIYSRNKGGTEYKMYSPLTLFADACTPDASNALVFNEAVTQYLTNKTPETKAKVAYFFNKWIVVNKELNDLSTNAPLVQPILPLAKKMSDVSQELLLVLDKKSTSKSNDLKSLIEQCNTKDHADVELAVYNSLENLVFSSK